MADGTPRQTTLNALLAYFKPKPLTMLGLGFSSGLPFLLVFDTLSAWLEDVGVSLTVIGFFILATFAYTLKFMWAPVVDRVNIPVLTRLLGHRRSWMIVTQGLIVIGLWIIAGIDPKAHLAQMALAAVLVGTISATQDVVIDAWRIEAVDIEQGGIMAAAYQWGYRIAMIVAGVVPLALADHMGWHFSYAVMACCMAIGMLAVLLAPREAEHTIRPVHFEGVPRRPVLEGIEWAGRLLVMIVAGLIMGSGLTGNASLLNGLLGHLGAGADITQALTDLWANKSWGVFVQVFSTLCGLALLILCILPMPVSTRPGAYFNGVFVAPLKDFFIRFEHLALLILALICFYRISEFVLSIMNPFYLQLGFTKLEIAGVRKVFGMWMSVLGVGLGGWVIARFGLRYALLIGAFVAPLSHIGFMYLAVHGHSISALSIAIGLDNVAASVQGTVLIAYMSSLTSRAFTATQYALFSSLYALLGKLVATQSGRIVDAAARAADNGGFPAMFKGLFANLPADSYVKAATDMGISPASLGAGYMTYLIYTMLIGVVAIGLCIWLFRAQGKALSHEGVEGS